LGDGQAKVNLQEWSLIKDEHTAVLVTMGTDASLDSRPMGCIQKDFDGTLWFSSARALERGLSGLVSGRAGFSKYCVTGS
jgi:general stress protein 26